jgi:hypothetical protein
MFPTVTFYSHLKVQNSFEVLPSSNPVDRGGLHRSVTFGLISISGIPGSLPARLLHFSYDPWTTPIPTPAQPPSPSVVLPVAPHRPLPPLHHRRHFTTAATSPPPLHRRHFTAATSPPPPLLRTKFSSSTALLHTSKKENSCGQALNEIKAWPSRSSKTYPLIA